MGQENSVVCRARAVGFAETSSAELVVESNGVRKSLLVNKEADFPVRLGDRIFCLNGRVIFGVPAKPSVSLFTLSSPTLDRMMFERSSQSFQLNEMIIEERIFQVMKLLSNQ